MMQVNDRASEGRALAVQEARAGGLWEFTPDRFWPIDATGRPCAWPVVVEVGQ